MTPQVLTILSTAVVAVLGVSVAVNGFFMKEALHELRELRDNDRDQDVELARIADRIHLPPRRLR